MIGQIYTPINRYRILKKLELKPDEKPAYLQLFSCQELNQAEQWLLDHGAEHERLLVVSVQIWKPMKYQSR